MTEYGAPPDVVQAMKNGACDVSLLGIDPGRGADIDFSTPYLRADFTFLVQASSDIDRIADIDRPGRRIALVRNHAMEFALRDRLEKADRVFAATPDESLDLVKAGDADVLAGIRPGLIGYARRWPGSKVLVDRYGENVLAFGVPKGRDDLLAAIDRFVMTARGSGLLSQLVQATGLAGAEPVLAS